MSLALLELLDALLAAADATPDLAPLLQRSLDLVCEATGASVGAVYLRYGDLLRLAARHGAETPSLALPVQCAAEDELPGALGRPVVRCLSLRAHDEPLGYLLLGAEHDSALEACSPDALDTLARVLALAVAHARQTEALCLAQQQLLEQHRFAAVGRLVPGVAHDLNNPLQAVTGFAQLLLTTEELSPSATRDLTRIHAQAQRAARLVENLLAVARPRRLEPRTVDVQDALERTVELLAYPLRLSSVDCALEAQGSLNVCADPGLLQTLLLYLVSNALDALSPTSGHGHIEIRARQEGETIRIEIADDGPPPADIEHRLAGPVLSLCAGMVSELGGRIAAEPRPEGGTIFTIEVPAAL